MQPAAPQRPPECLLRSLGRERGGDGGAKLSPGRAKSLREFYSHVHCWQLICISASAEEYFFLYWQFDLTVLPLLSYESSRKLVALRARKRSLLARLVGGAVNANSRIFFRAHIVKMLSRESDCFWVGICAAAHGIILISPPAQGHTLLCRAADSLESCSARETALLEI